MVVSARPEQAVPLDQKVTKIQNRLFENAHAQPLELKYLGIALSRQGIRGEKLYGNPDMMPMPLCRCEYLSSLSNRQKAIVSACYFVNLYKLVANSEAQTLVSNMAAAEKSFAPYSDEYMILHQETSEELDHIWTFRTVHRMVCRETGVQDSFDSPGFFRGQVGLIPQEDYDQIDTRFQLTEDFEQVLSWLKQEGGLQTLLKEMNLRGRAWRYRILHFLIGEAPRLLSSEEVQKYGLGGLWLLFRYVSNVELKQGEAYLFDSLEEFDYEPLAYEINQAHLHDEARHYTTSFDIGLALYEAASEEAQAFIREMLRLVMEDYISGTFLNYPEMLELAEQGKVPTIIRLCKDTLRMALCHPDFEDSVISLSDLFASWKAMPWPNVIYPVGPGAFTQKRWRYIAQQFERLRTKVEFEYDQNRLGNLYRRYQKILSVDSLSQTFELP